MPGKGKGALGGCFRLPSAKLSGIFSNLWRSSFSWLPTKEPRGGNPFCRREPRPPLSLVTHTRALLCLFCASSPPFGRLDSILSLLFSLTMNRKNAQTIMRPIFFRFPDAKVFISVPTELGSSRTRDAKGKRDEGVAGDDELRGWGSAEKKSLILAERGRGGERSCKRKGPCGLGKKSKGLGGGGGSKKEERAKWPPSFCGPKKRGSVCGWNFRTVVVTESCAAKRRRP